MLIAAPPSQHLLRREARYVMCRDNDFLSCAPWWWQNECSHSFQDCYFGSFRKVKISFYIWRWLLKLFGAIFCGTNSFEPKCKFSSVEQIEENSFATNYLLQKNVNIHWVNCFPFFQGNYFICRWQKGRNLCKFNSEMNLKRIQVLGTNNIHFHY